MGKRLPEPTGTRRVGHVGIQYHDLVAQAAGSDESPAEGIPQ